MAFDSLSEKLQNVFKNLRSKGRLTEDDVKTALREVKMALLEADVNFKVVKNFTKAVQERAVGSDVMNGLNPGQMVIKIVNEELVALMGSETTEIAYRPGQQITVIMMVGLQGAGKTTTTAKLAGKMKQKGKKPLLAACDVYRPAAIQQLQINGEKQQVDVFAMGDKHRPADIAKAALEHAKKNGNNVVILDTAGRLHVDEEMMAEHPEQVFGNYFGISGNEETKNTLGLGGFSDYYEGISLSWFLREKAGLKEGEGSALFYGRDDDLYGEVKDLGYFFPENGDYSGYYLELSDICSVSGVVPVIAVSKNGYPLLPEHNHDLEGNVDYNVFNGNALAKGFETEIGLVKNVSGPFVAGLANLDGVYGGYRNETAGDCIRIDLYVDRGLYDGESAGKYTDVPSDAWYAEYVNELSERGVVNGRTEGKFEPEAPVTRAEFVKLAAGIAGADVSRYSVSAFDDVSANAWYAPYVAWAAETGIVTGCSDAEFCPDREISRQDMAVILCRLAEKSGDVLKSDNPPLTFADAAEIAPYAEDAVAAMQKAGVISGRGGQKFAPRENATRAEACKMLVTLAEQIF